MTEVDTSGTLVALATWADSEALLPAYLNRHGAGGHSWQGPCAGQAAAHADVRPVDAILFHPCRLVRFDSGSYRGTCRVPVSQSHSTRETDGRRKWSRIADPRRRRASGAGLVDLATELKSDLLIIGAKAWQ
jgi:hypothetical protein